MGFIDLLRQRSHLSEPKIEICDTPHWLIAIWDNHSRSVTHGSCAPLSSNGQVGEELAQSGVNAMCRMCFLGESQGSERARRMLSCKSCGKKYHKNCICFIGAYGVVPRAVFVRVVIFLRSAVEQEILTSLCSARGVMP
ncbi:hypothetical protein Bca52824_083384 [Brassica carinata]|uniref:PHD-type domain-containing protein n=1 Tax=Brassica carinata TaxID=52824 RepID=A0A8X7PM98_BRACI|nr:hypothetical protein Bca52824_083384 [Brassica carinata]